MEEAWQHVDLPIGVRRDRFQVGFSVSELMSFSFLQLGVFINKEI